ncbi:MAG: FAD-dependent oxidoreductase, partial [Campylobacterales bacterium]|nr:FAD-dependent oxidoreductase [Campylobacterales bacterium]
MKKIAVIGAGYGGLRAVEHLCKNVDFDIYLFDKERYHYLQTEAYGYIAGRFDLGDVALDLKNWCYGFDNSINFIQEEVVLISSEQNMIKTDKGSYHFDYLIIATGAHTNFFSFISGLREYSYGVKNLQKSYKFRRDFEEILYQKLSSNDDVINLV